MIKKIDKTMGYMGLCDIVDCLKPATYNRSRIISSNKNLIHTHMIHIYLCEVHKDMAI